MSELTSDEETTIFRTETTIELADTDEFMGEFNGEFIGEFIGALIGEFIAFK